MRATLDAVPSTTVHFLEKFPSQKGFVKIQDMISQQNIPPPTSHRRVRTFRNLIDYIKKNEISEELSSSHEKYTQPKIPSSEYCGSWHVVKVKDLRFQHNRSKSTGQQIQKILSEQSLEGKLREAMKQDISVIKKRPSLLKRIRTTAILTPNENQEIVQTLQPQQEVKSKSSHSSKISSEGLRSRAIKMHFHQRPLTSKLAIYSKLSREGARPKQERPLSSVQIEKCAVNKDLPVNGIQVFIPEMTQITSDLELTSNGDLSRKSFKVNKSKASIAICDTQSHTTLYDIAKKQMEAIEKLRKSLNINRCERNSTLKLSKSMRLLGQQISIKAKDRLLSRNSDSQSPLKPFSQTQSTFPVSSVFKNHTLMQRLASPTDHLPKSPSPPQKKEKEEQKLIPTIESQIMRPQSPSITNLNLQFPEQTRYKRIVSSKTFRGTRQEFQQRGPATKILACIPAIKTFSYEQGGGLKENMIQQTQKSINSLSNNHQLRIKIKDLINNRQR